MWLVSLSRLSRYPESSRAWGNPGEGRFHSSRLFYEARDIEVFAVAQH